MRRSPRHCPCATRALTARSALAAALLLALSCGRARAHPKGINLEQVVNAKLQHFVQPGDPLEVRVEVVRQEADAADVRASAAVEERTVAQASLHYRLIPASADTPTGRACARMQAFYEMLAADMERVAADGRSPAVRAGGEAVGG